MGIARRSTIVNTMGRLTIREEPTFTTAEPRGTSKGDIATDTLSISIRPNMPVLTIPFSERELRFPVSEATVAISLGREAFSVIKARVTMDLGIFSVRVTRALPLISRPVFIVTRVVLRTSRLTLPVKDTLPLGLLLLLLGVGVPPTVSIP